MSDTDMVERVARAIYEAKSLIEGVDATWDEVKDRATRPDGYAYAKLAYEATTNAARAAIEAMMEPTDEMVRSMLAVEWPATYREHLRHPMDGTKSQIDTENRIKKTREKWQASLRASLSQENRKP